MRNIEEALILSLESSGSVCGAVLSKGEEILAEYRANENNLHDRLLAVFAKRLLEDFSLSVSELDAVAVNAGPGSFTGLRIGASLAKGMCFGNTPALIAVPGMHAIASFFSGQAALKKKSTLFIALISYKNFIYTQKFSTNVEPLTGILFRDLDDIPEEEYRDCFIAGSAAGLLSNDKENTNVTFIYPGMISSYALKMYKNKLFVKPADFSPEYSQDFKPTLK